MRARAWTSLAYVRGLEGSLDEFRTALEIAGKQLSVLAPKLTPDQERAVRLYLMMRRRMHRAGIDRAELMSALELLHHLETQHTDLHAEAHPIITAYNAARFGKRQLPRNRQHDDNR